MLRGERIPLAVATGARALKLNVPPVPELPIYLAALGDASVRLAGELADGWAPFLYPRRCLAEGMQRLREGAARAGQPDRCGGAGTLAADRRRPRTRPGPGKERRGSWRSTWSAWARSTGSR